MRRKFIVVGAVLVILVMVSSIGSAYFAPLTGSFFIKLKLDFLIIKLYNL